jgi:hypothetical protein
MDLTDYVDVTGTLVRVLRTYREKNGSGSSDHVTPPVFLPPALQAPLSQSIDQFWGVTRDSQNKTPRDIARDKAVQNLANTAASDIDGNFPLTGRLFALVAKRSFLVDGERHLVPILDLVYSLPHADFTFNLGPPAFRLNFDTYMDFTIDVPEAPLPLTATARTVLDNAQFSPTNFAAAFVDLFAGDVISALASRLNQESPSNVGGIGNLLGQLSPLLATQQSLGFGRMKIGLDTSLVASGQPATIFLQLTHSGLPTPVVTDGPSIGFFELPVLVTGQSQIRAGGQLLASGNFFKPANSTALHLVWDSRGSESDIELTPPHPPMTVTKVWQPGDTRGELTVTGVPSDTTFVVRVRDCMALSAPLSDSSSKTCSDWSAPLTISTGVSDNVEIRLRSVSSTSTTLLANATLGSGGTFSSVVTIPTGTAPGRYSLNATVGHQVASATLLVLGPGTVAPPELSLMNGNTNTPQQHPSATEQEGVTVRGEGFPPGLVMLTADTGQSLGTALAPASGLFTTTFVWPIDVVGNHRIIASQVIGGITTQQASLSLVVNLLPR